MWHLIIAHNALALMTLMLVLCVSFTWQKVRARDHIAFYAFHSFLASYMSSMRNSNLEMGIAGCLCPPQLGLDALSWIGFTFELSRIQSMLGIPSQPPERQKTAKKAFFTFLNPRLFSKSKIAWRIPRRCLEFHLEACNEDYVAHCKNSCVTTIFFHHRLNFWTHNHFNGWVKGLIHNL